MAVKYVTSQATNSASAASHAISFAYSQTRYDCLLFFIRIRSSSVTLSSIDYNGITPTLITSIPGGGGALTSIYGYYINTANLPTSGTYNLNVNLSGSAAIDVNILQYSGTAATPIGAVNTGSNSATTSHTFSVTPTAARSWCLVSVNRSSFASRNFAGISPSPSKFRQGSGTSTIATGDTDTPFINSVGVPTTFTITSSGSMSTNGIVVEILNQAVQSITFSESNASTDVITSAKGFIRTFLESDTLAEAFTRALQAFRSFTESVATSDMFLIGGWRRDTKNNSTWDNDTSNGSSWAKDNASQSTWSNDSSSGSSWTKDTPPNTPWNNS